jgi:putative alpha-1,2-mannosidase
MSAWLVFGALGLFPIAGTDVYLLGSPLFTEATLHLPGGDLRVVAPVTGDEALVPTAVTLDDSPLDRPRVSHASIAGGATLRFEMSP